MAVRQILWCSAALFLAMPLHADVVSQLNIKADCGGCQSFEVFQEAVQAFGDTFLRTTRRLELPALAPEILITSFKPRSLGSRLSWGVVGGKDEMAAEMQVDGMVFRAQETARSSFMGYAAVAESVAEQLAVAWSARLGATRSVSALQGPLPQTAPNPPPRMETVSGASGVRVVTPEQAAMAKAMGLKLD